MLLYKSNPFSQFHFASASDWILYTNKKGMKEYIQCYDLIFINQMNKRKIQWNMKHKCYVKMEIVNYYNQRKEEARLIFLSFFLGI